MIRVEMPTDVRNIVILRQAEIKVEKNLKSYSQQMTIFRIIKEWKEMRDAMRRPS